MIPRLTASLTGPLQKLEERILDEIARLALAAAAIELERTAPAE